MLSVERRIRLLELARQHDFMIIEDDYDNEFHFGQRPILPISSYNNAKNFIYIGTLSKIVAPALRIGYVASSSENINKIANHRKIIDVQGDNIMEEAVLHLINEGKIKRHLKKTNLIYKAKRDYFESLCQLHLKDKITFKDSIFAFDNKYLPKGKVSYGNVILLDNFINTDLIISISKDQIEKDTILFYMHDKQSSASNYLDEVVGKGKLIRIK